MTLPREVDAVVIGAGPNGLVAANRLAEAPSRRVETYVHVASWRSAQVAEAVAKWGPCRVG